MRTWSMTAHTNAEDHIRVIVVWFILQYTQRCLLRFLVILLAYGILCSFQLALGKSRHVVSTRQTVEGSTKWRNGVQVKLSRAVLAR